jgi:hypothetical protein
MEPIIEKKSMFSPHLGLVIASFAAFLGIMTMGRSSVLAIEAVDNFSIGIPFILVCFFMQATIEWPQRYQLIINTINLILVLIGSFFCLLGLYKCFALVSEKAAVNFAVFGVFIFLLIFSTGIYELVFKDKKASMSAD